MRSKSKALSLKLKDVLDPEFVREVLDRKISEANTPQAKLLRSSISTTLVRKKVLAAFTPQIDSTTLADLASRSTSEVKRMASLGSKTTRWLEEYLQLLGVTLPETRSVHGMSKEARAYLGSL